MHEVARLLDFSLPPPGYPDGRADGAHLGMDAAQSLTTAWAHYKARHDPPGMYVGWEPDDKHFDPDGDGEWHACLGGEREFWVGSIVVWWRACAAADKDSMHADARAAAWAWCEHRLALAERLKSSVLVASETFRGRPLRTVIPASEARHFDECEVLPLDVWPVILTWTDEQVAEVERWLTNSPAAMPAVLRG